MLRIAFFAVRACARKILLPAACLVSEAVGQTDRYPHKHVHTYTYFVQFYRKVFIVCLSSIFHRSMDQHNFVNWCYCTK